MIDPSRLKVFDLEQPRHNQAPIHPGHVPPGSSYLLHRRHEPRPGGDGRSGAAGVWITSDHAGTHIDALSHQAVDLKLFGGASVTEVQSNEGFRQLGVETIGPIVTRGWLIDLGVVEPDGWIELETVQAAATAQGVRPGAGDVVLARTGNGVHWSDPDRYLRGSGMRGRVSEWLAGLGIRAVGADNMAWDWIGEPDRDYGFTLPAHALLLVRSGVHIIENLFLEELAAAGVHEFTFICLPLKLKGATGSPVRPVALVG